MNVSDLTNAEVLAVLYNMATPQGLGFLRYDPTPMTIEDAENLVGTGERTGSGSTISFDYHNGRVMKVRIGADEIDTFGYNRDNGENAAERAINAYRKDRDVNNFFIQSNHYAKALEKYPAFKAMLAERIGK